MIKAAWITDPHVPFFNTPAPQSLLQGLKDTHQVILITGDIAEHRFVAECIELVRRASGLPVFYVRGNHDFYGVMTVRGAQEVDQDSGYLTNKGAIPLGENTYLVGQDGFYDTRNGNVARSCVLLSDMHAIGEFRYKHTKLLWDDIRRVADSEVNRAKTKLLDACKQGAERVVFLTHVPPFSGATWHEGQLSNADWLPWMSCQGMGNMLLTLAHQYPGTFFEVYCGHTHSPGTYQAADNLTVYTGKGEYGELHLSGTVTLPSLGGLALEGV